MRKTKQNPKTENQDMLDAAHWAVADPNEEPPEAYPKNDPEIDKRKKRFLREVHELRLKGYETSSGHDDTVGRILCKFWASHRIESDPFTYLCDQTDALILAAIHHAEDDFGELYTHMEHIVLAERIVLSGYKRIDRGMGAMLYLCDASENFHKYNMGGTISFVDYVYHKYPIEIRAISKQEFEEAGLEASEEQVPSGEKREETRQAASAAAPSVPAQEKQTWLWPDVLLRFDQDLESAIVFHDHKQTGRILSKDALKVKPSAWKRLQAIAKNEGELTKQRKDKTLTQTDKNALTALNNALAKVFPECKGKAILAGKATFKIEKARDSEINKLMRESKTDEWKAKRDIRDSDPGIKAETERVRRKSQQWFPNSGENQEDADGYQ